MAELLRIAEVKAERLAAEISAEARKLKSWDEIKKGQNLALKRAINILEKYID